MMSVLSGGWLIPISIGSWTSSLPFTGPDDWPAGVSYRSDEPIAGKTRDGLRRCFRAIWPGSTAWNVPSLLI
jgi:hypothetical protein